MDSRFILETTFNITLNCKMQQSYRFDSSSFYIHYLFRYINIEFHV